MPICANCGRRVPFQQAALVPWPIHRLPVCFDCLADPALNLWLRLNGPILAARKVLVFVLKVLVLTLLTWLLIERMVP